MSVLSGSSILVTGGTGSFGKAFIQELLDNYDPGRIVIYSRDELKQYECRQMFKDDSRLRWFIGDIRDLHRLNRAMHQVDYVVHAAALKQVDTAEYNPWEFVQTNIIGSQNVIEACIDAGVKKVVALSTDKASSPINLYGATKLTADSSSSPATTTPPPTPPASVSCATGTSWAAAARSSRSSASSARRVSPCRSPTCG